MADGFGRRTQTSIFRAGASGAQPKIPTGWPALVARAQRAMSDEAWAYVNGSSGTESTAEANVEAFEQWRIVPRVLRDVSERELGVTLFGHHYPTPLLASPVGVLELVDPDADLAIARAASSLGIPAILSNQASVPMEKVFAEGGDGPKWFQLYWSSSDELVQSLVSGPRSSAPRRSWSPSTPRCSAGGRATSTSGSCPSSAAWGSRSTPVTRCSSRLVAERMARPADAGAPKPKVTPAAVRTLIGMTRRHPGRFRANLRSGEPRAAVETFLDVFSRADLTWSDLAFLRAHTSLPIVLKGIQHPDDARRALDAGMDGVIVSNHAGRQIDGAIASLDALPAVVEAVGGADARAVRQRRAGRGRRVPRSRAGRGGRLRRTAMGLRDGDRRRGGCPRGAAQPGRGVRPGARTERPSFGRRADPGGPGEVLRARTDCSPAPPAAEWLDGVDMTASRASRPTAVRDTVAALTERPSADVLILGGGINGIATFRELALQGVDVALVERGDYVSGASSASSHMVHGGVRYLENGEFRLVNEAVHERNRLLKNAPHYVRPLETTIPIFKTLSGAARRSPALPDAQAAHHGRARRAADQGRAHHLRLVLARRRLAAAAPLPRAARSRWPRCRT